MEVGAGTTGSRRDLSSSFRACPCPTLLRLDVMAQVCLQAQGWVGRGPSWGRGHREGAWPPSFPIDHCAKHCSRQPPAEPSTIPHVCI